jgi:hypothetical protein
MNPRFISVVLLVGLSRVVSSAQSVTVNYSGGPVAGSPAVVGPDGTTPLADGNAVEIGYFDSSFNISLNAGNLAALAAARQSGAWHLFGSTNITSNFGILGTSPGSFSASAQQPGSAGFTGQQIDLWVFQTTGAAAPDALLDNVTAWGIFSSTINLSSSRTWTFPAASFGGVDNITTSDVSTSGIFYHGQISGGGDLEVTGTAAVPEPSAAVLSGLGMVVGALVIRRRNRKSR